MAGERHTTVLRIDAKFKFWTALMLKGQQSRSWGFLVHADAPIRSEHAFERGARAQRAFPCALDHRAIRDRVGKRHAEFDQVGAPAHQRLHQSRRTLRRGIAGRQIRDQSFAAVALQAVKQAPDPRHASSSSLKFSR